MWVETIAVFCIGLAMCQEGVFGDKYNKVFDYKDLGNGTVAFDTCTSNEDFVNPLYYDDPNECYINKFPKTTQDEKEKRNCCGFDGLLHITTCDGTDAKSRKIQIKNVPVCQYPDTSQEKQNGKIDLDCPSGCKPTTKTLKLHENKKTFEIINDDTIKIEGKLYDEGYCLVHKCDDPEKEGWKTEAEVCDCHYKEEIEIKTKEFISELKKSNGEEKIRSCCGDRTPIELIESGNKINTCPGNPKCKESEETLEVENNTNYTKVIMKMNKKVKTKTDSCVGVTIEGKYVYAKCKKPCQGKTPCLGRCCQLGESWNLTQASCQKEDKPVDISDIFEKNFKYSEYSEKRNAGKKVMYSETKCEETKVSIKNGKLTYTDKSNGKQTTLNETSFCYTEILGGQRMNGLNGRIMFLLAKNKDISANQSDEVKGGIKGHDKELAYTVVLAFSTVLLFITIFLYVTHTALWKHYSKLMVNFATSLFIANILLLMIWKGGLKDNCTSLGLALQFFFLATFTWMTIMSFEIFIQLKSSTLVNHANDHKRIAKQACIGYGFPLFMIFITGIVEATAPICATYRPRFSIGSCGTFFGHTDKFLWLYGPILVMLLLNTGMMIYIFISVYRQKSRTDGHGANRSQKKDMICLYLRLFLGMGFIWYFEILSWAVNPKDDAWILTDFLNMMQGTYVFFIFVCKRNVLAVVFGKRSRLYSTVHQASIKLKGGKSTDVAQGSQTTDQSEFSQSMITDKPESVQLNPSP